jgi:DnaJ-class molecular chaperone
VKEITCIECRGRGYIIVVDQGEPCPLCEGKGTIREDLVREIEDMIIDPEDTPF